ncbi:ABC transporter substrate-binding protein [Brevibacillus reuszeri]|uniref:ABC transporter substrate-binding protein n=1 Tax=Brevibacillus reuszeri TaxID=54915 RepID=A0A0K9YWU4_9BACL|nr:transporter substrate-binding domain-containing protein [Brevibacillus reuszeri]KNB73097.1 ABC transporter substrate-binding protein [Brevibacillus reuszeri]MED1856688.1 transporter substrate-binding domain-containing protein [Brevibacillus reuszeri]GED68565.1 ABC transporter substrate-binding protein [Brevibacillus reuszeri]
MKKKMLAGLMSIVLLGSVLLAGCGDQKDGAQAGGQKEFVYAMSGIYKPFNYKENGELVGFDVEIGEALAAKMGMTPKAITFPYETIIQGLIDKKFDAILGSMTITEERLKAVNFSTPYYRSGSQIFVDKDNEDIKSAADLKGKKIGTTPATNYEKVALTLTDKENVMKYSSGDVPAMMDLKTKRIDAVIADQIFGLLAIKDGGLEIKPVGDPLVYDEQGIAVNKDNKELLDKMNKAFEEIVADGTYDKISQKWFGTNILGDPKK